MRVQILLYIFLLILASLLLVNAQKPGTLPDVLNLRRKFHRHLCPHRRCMPLHSKVPFP
ncbi:apelin receptor early endogenous ligand [Scleropages formosus]|uniref:apelin receptor early endogenous ligand n=1 Tax=Scleropages formosus TaxID=113540 RepID=UPI000878FB13|nr:apelin receptor early endogenous ligand [Scleropages formosus]